MEIWTLLKANIRKKKGTFISITLLTAIIVAVMTTIFSVRDNYEKGFKEAMAYADSPEIVTLIRTQVLTDELRKNVENHEFVEQVGYYDSLCANSLYTAESVDGNSHFLMEMRDGIRLFNEELDGFVEDIQKLQSGEIYLPLGLRSKISCEVGDTVMLDMFFDGTEEFVIKGFVQEPSQGALTIGWKQLFISHEDYERIYETYLPVVTEGMTLEVTMMMIHQAPDCDLSVAKFQRQLNLDTGIITNAIGALNTEQSLRYSTLMPDIILDIVMAFAILLFAIVLIVMSHSIGTEIEIEYTTLGVLKSQGFTKEKLRLLFLTQYLFAQLVGVVVGCIAAIPLERMIGSACQSITAVLPGRGLAVGKSMAYIVITLLVSAVLILIKTRKIARIAPLRAISGGREEIFFDSRLNAPITKKGLAASLSLRQFTSAKKRYIGTVFIVAILTFCMITVNLTGNLLSSRKALTAMGMIIPDIEVFYQSPEQLESWEKIDAIVESYTDIEEKNSWITGYVTLNGENLLCEACEFPEYLPGVMKGRAPLYANEIVVTDMVADALDLKMGDEVTVALREEEGMFIISGIYQTGSDSGMAFAMNFAGIKELDGNTEYANRYYTLADTSQADAIADEIVAQYGDVLGVAVYAEADNTVTTEYDDIVSLLKVIIYTFSILFALVVVHMVCTKSFIQERTDIGIYKAVGFTTRQLRVQFAVRFFILATLGTIVGAILSALLSAKMLGAVLSLIGLSRVVLEYSFAAVFIPFVAISVSFFVFAYLASGKIRKVAVRELVVE